MTQVNKKELISAVHQELVDTLGDGNSRSFKKQSIEEILNSLVEVIQKAVANGDKVVLVGFGTFEKSHREKRSGRNPKTGEIMDIAARNVPKFSAGKQFKERVN